MNDLFFVCFIFYCITGKLLASLYFMMHIAYQRNFCKDQDMIFVILDKLKVVHNFIINLFSFSNSFLLTAISLKKKQNT